MRFMRVAAAVTATAVGVLTLGACDGHTSTAASASSPTVATTPGGTTASPAAGSTVAPAAGGGTEAPAGGTTAATGGGAAPASVGGAKATAVPARAAEAAASSRCHVGDIGYSWATGGDAVPDPHSTNQQTAVVMLKNTSGHTCVLRGFPGVDLVNSGQRWSLPRTSQSPTALSLKPGDSTQFTVTFLPWSAEGNVASNNFAPTTLVITLPNETKSFDIPWRWGHVLLQDGATHPGTYVSPVGY